MDISLTAKKKRGKTTKVNEPEAHTTATPEELHGAPILRTLVMVANTNPVGSIFNRLLTAVLISLAASLSDNVRWGDIQLCRLGLGGSQTPSAVP